MTIPKVIFQTWKTKNLHPNVELVRNKIQNNNPNYGMILYDDDDMDLFIKKNFDEKIYKAYNNLYNGAAKADFWRYCILFLRGGIYLDIDADIIKSLDELINNQDKCIITREGNKGTFNNWILIFERNHPILKKTIEYCCHNIENKTTNDVFNLTGPGVLTKAINDLLIPIYDKNISNLYFESDEDLNKILNNSNNEIKTRFYGIDMENYAKFKHPYQNELYHNQIYWKCEHKIFNN